MYKEKESGRSMVEMLGVLAIIGVLSVGGIAGYTTAMNKHRANQILNEASVRAIVVSTQIQRGATAPTLGEFTDNEVGGARFGTGVQNADGTATWTTTDKRFSLALENVPDDICDQMKATVGQNSIIKAIADDCTTITYNNDLSPTDTESCPVGTSENGKGGVAKKLSDGKVCKCEADDKVFTDEGCISQPSSCNSYTTNVCGIGYYCQTSNPQKCSGGNGTCKSIQSVSGSMFAGYLTTDSKISWWSGYSWCLGNGKSGYVPYDTLALNSEITSTSSSFWTATNLACGDCDDGCNYHSKASGTGREAIHHRALCAE